MTTCKPKQLMPSDNGMRGWVRQQANLNYVHGSIDTDHHPISWPRCCTAAPSDLAIRPPAPDRTPTAPVSRLSQLIMAWNARNQRFWTMKIKLIKISIVVDIINNVRQSTTTVATRSSLKHKVQNTIELYQPYVFIEKLSILSITLQRFFFFFLTHQHFTPFAHLFTDEK